MADSFDDGHTNSPCALLYERARRSVNQRHIRKTWFELDQRLTAREKKRFQPPEDTALTEDDWVPLKSIVLVEHLLKDTPIHVQEMSSEEFWEFLFSDSWRQGQSVRVLEGELLQRLVVQLVELTSIGQVIQYTTVAYANNQRQRPVTYKQTTQKGTIDETLLLEFIYYGRPKETNMLKEKWSTSSFPNITTCNPSSSSSSSSLNSSCEETDFNDNVGLRRRKYRKGKLSKRSKAQLTAMYNKRLESLLHHRVKTKLSSMHFIKELEAKQPRCSSRRHRHRHRRTLGLFNLDNDDYRVPPDKLNLRTFRCTEKVVYLGKFDLPNDSSDSEDDNTSEHTDLEQIPLVGAHCPRILTADKTKPVEVRLRERKAALVEERAAKRKALEERKQNAMKTKITRTLSPLHLPTYLNECERDFSAYLDLYRAKPESCAQFDGYVDILRRTKKERHKLNIEKNAAKIGEMFTKVNSGCGLFADTVGGITDSIACRMFCYEKRDIAFPFLTKQEQRNYLAGKLAASGGPVNTKTLEEMMSERKDQPIWPPSAPLVYVTTPTKITYLAPASKELARQKKKELWDRLARKFGIYNRKDTSATRLPSVPSETQVKIEHDVEESPDSESEESDGLANSAFDTKKLKIGYSLEEIVNAKAAEKRRVRREKMEKIRYILRKYLRIQRVLKAFQGDKPAKEESKASTNRSEDEKETPKDEERGCLGRLKWFPFLDAKKIPIICSEYDIPQPNNLKYFREKLEKALDEFIVRKELVVSDHNSKASVSVTFTRHSVITDIKNAGTKNEHRQEMV